MRDNFDNFIKGLVKLTNSHCESQENPKAIITLGEQGSGKEVLALEAQDELSHRGGSVLVGTDYYKTHSENYLENVKVDDRSTSINSIKEAKYISDRVLDHAIENKHNVVINENNENPYDFKATTDKLKSAGYEVELRTIATPHEHSLLRNNMQYEDQKGNLGFGDHKAIQEFDQKGMSEILEVSEKSKLVDKVKVYDRVGNEVYNNELNPDGETWLKKESASETYDFEKNKPLGKSEYQYNQVAWQQLVHMKMSSHAPKSEIDLTIQEKESHKDIQYEQGDKDKTRDISSLVIKSPESYKGVQQGELVDQDENHILMKINRFTAIKYSKDRVQDTNDQDLEIGQQLFINHGLHGDYKVMDQQEIQQHQDQEQDRQLTQASAEQDFQQDLMR